MEKLLKAAAVLLLIGMLCMLFSSCGGGDVPVTTEEPSSPQSEEQTGGSETPTVPDTRPAFVMNGRDGVTVRTEDDLIFAEVPNETAVFDLNKFVTAREDVEWQVYLTPEGINPIITKRLSLSEGNNVFYITVFSAEKEVLSGYTLNVNRAGTYTVSFEGLTEKQTVVEGGLAKAPSGVPTREGYNFDTWDYDFTQPVRSNLTIPAKWIAASYLVTFDANLGTVEELSMEVTYGEEATLPQPEREGFVFAGWYDRENVVKSGVWTITSDVTLVARWSNRVINVTLDPAGGTVNGSEAEVVMRVDYGSEVVFPAPVRDGFTFGGWYNGETLVENGVFEHAEDLRLTAKWHERAATVIFVENGGQGGTHDEVLKYDAELPLPVRTGFSFGGWFSDPELTVQVGTVPQVDGSVRLYAWWSEEGKPGEFVYELSGVNYKITERKDRTSTSPVPEYIGGLKTVDAMERPNPNAGIVLDKSTLTVKIDRTVKISAVFTPKYQSDDPTLIYTSQNPAAATVDENGVVTGVASGKGACVIKISSVDGEFTATCYIAVSSAAKDPQAGLTLSAAKLQVLIDERAALSVTYIPEYDDDDRTLTFVSDNEAIATVDETGVITGMTLGSCTVTVFTANSAITGVCEVQVVEEKTNDHPGMVLSASELTMNTGWVKEVAATYTPRLLDADRTVVWTSDNEEVATVVEGTVTAVGEGQCRITASDLTGEFSAVVNVTVRRSGIYTERADTDLAVGETGAFIAYVLPDTEGGDTTILYESTDESVARVKDGVITAVGAGSCTLTATAVQTDEFVSVRLTVHDLFSIVGNDDVEVIKGDYNFDITILNGSSFLQFNRLVRIYGNYTWVLSSDAEMRSVIGSKAVSVPADGSAVYFAHLIGADGSVIETYSLTVGKYNGGEVTPTPPVTETPTVTPTPAVPVTGIQLPIETLDLKVHDVYELHPAILPAEATNKEYSVTLSEEGVVIFESGTVKATGEGEVTLTFTTLDGGFEATLTVTVTKTVWENPHILHETPDAGPEYQNALTFLGDSTTAHMITYGALSDGTATKQVWRGSVGNTITFLYVNDIEIIYPQTGETMKIVDAAALAKPRYLVITLGVTGGVSMNLQQTEFITLYKALIDSILEVSPDTAIIVQSIFPVGENRKGDGYDYTRITNEGIVEANNWITEMVREYYEAGSNVRYLNTYPLLLGENGYMKEEYGNGDGLHLGLRGYQIVLENIRTHAITLQ